MSSDMRIAFLGTGLMGSHMARNILKAGFSVAAWNRTLAKAEALRGMAQRFLKPLHRRLQKQILSSPC